jgi:hypothetical protein
MEAVFHPKIIVQIFSGGFLPASFAFRQEQVENHQKKIRKISARNTASKINGITWNRLFPSRAVRPGYTY